MNIKLNKLMTMISWWYRSLVSRWWHQGDTMVTFLLTRKNTSWRRKHWRWRKTVFTAWHGGGCCDIFAWRGHVTRDRILGSEWHTCNWGQMASSAPSPAHRSPQDAEISRIFVNMYSLYPCWFKQLTSKILKSIHSYWSNPVSGKV